MFFWSSLVCEQGGNLKPEQRYTGSLHRQPAGGVHAVADRNGSGHQRCKKWWNRGTRFPESKLACRKFWSQEEKLFKTSLYKCMLIIMSQTKTLI